jgi:hypothetical protein
MKKTTVLEDKLFKMLKDNLADLWQDDLIAEAGQRSIQEKWSQKYKKSIDCSHPKGFSQKAHCAGKKKHNESMQVMEMTCPDCGMCQSHGTLNEIKKGAKDSNGFTKCWPGKHAEGTKKGKDGGQVRNCVPNESQGVAEVLDTPEKKAAYQAKAKASVPALNQQYSNAREKAGRDWAPGGEEGLRKHGDQEQLRKADAIKNKILKRRDLPEPQGVAEDWNKVNHHDHTNGLSQKAVNAYRHEHPGSKLKTAVTTKPSKLKAGSKAAKRRKSFCARMSGNKGPMKKPNGKPTPKALALRRWHCESLEELLVTARQKIYEAEGEPEGLKHLTPHLAKDILDQIETEGVHAIVKSIEWGDGGAKELINIIKRELKKVADNK